MKPALYWGAGIDYTGGMNPPNHQVRRATLEDLPALRQLWKEERLPITELEKRFTEFQVAVNEKGELLGGLGVQIAGHYGRLHSEAFAHPECEDELRPKIWERVQMLATNHRLARFWTQESAPFWKHYLGFKDATEEELAQLPPLFGDRKAHWSTLKIREEKAAILTMDQHLELFRQGQKEDIENLQRLARRARTIATVLAVALFIVVLVAGVYLLRRGPFFMGH